MSSRTIQLTESLHQYLLEHSSRESPLLARLRETTATMPGAQMQISPEQGQLMALLVKTLGAKRCIEIGTFTGYSSLVVALALPRDGKLIACDINAEFTNVARKFWQEAGVESKIDLRLQPALRTLEELLEKGQARQFDFAFIDADKVNYLAYYEKLLDLMRPGGLIAVDNTLWSGKVADLSVVDPDSSALRTFNDYVHRDERVDLSLIPIGDGLTLLRKRGD